MEEVGSRKSVNFINSINSPSSIQTHFIALSPREALLTSLLPITPNARVFTCSSQVDLHPLALNHQFLGSQQLLLQQLTH
jgi:hypothetical protein